MIELRTLGAIDIRDSDGRALTSVLAQPKRLALLAYLAVASPTGFHRRDSLLPIFWYDLHQERARSALRKALHYLRQSLSEGTLVSRGEEEIGLADGVVWCDARAFEEAAASGRAGQAFSLYRGDFLNGLHVPDAPEFERWLDRERERLRRLAVDACKTWSLECEAAQNPQGAVDAARRAVGLSLEDESAVFRLLSLLDRLGRRVEALRTFEEFRGRLADEYELSPSAELIQLVEAIRAGKTGPASPPAVLAQGRAPDPPDSARLFDVATTDAVATGMDRAPVTRRRLTRAHALGGASGVVILAVGAALVTGFGDRAKTTAPVLAVGKINDYTGPDTLSGAVADMLSTNLARLPDLQVISNARIQELLGKLGSNTPAALARSAERAGASELVDGALYRLTDGGLRFDLRRVRLGAGSVVAAYTVEGPDVFSVVDRATRELSSDLKLRSGAIQIAEATTRSLSAYRLYERGLREYYQRGDPRTAYELFSAALEADSTFAMAAYYTWNSAATINHPLSNAYGERAVRMAHHATDRERLMILGAWHLAWSEPSGRAVAETLAIRYPTEPDGHLWLGVYRLWSGEFLAAVRDLAQVVAMDSISFGGKSGRCRACNAMLHMLEAHALADSLKAAERVARNFIQLQPESGLAWGTLANILERRGETEAALRAYATAERLTPIDPTASVERRAAVAMRAGRFPAADSLLQTLALDSDVGVRGTMLWYRVLSFRNQGRLEEALARALELRRLAAGTAVSMDSATWAAGPEAQVLFELGRYREAAALFGAIARQPPFESQKRAKIARHRAWYLTHSATALAAAGDTGALAALADSIERIGQESTYGRDRLLHHHVRGLLLRARNRLPEAENEFRRAIFSTTAGYTRTNLELGRLLLAQRRPREAIAVLQPALRGPLDASNLYLTHSELHELLAQAFEAAGQPDSAAHHYRWIVRAWRDADPQFHTRRDVGKQRLAAMEGSGH